MWASYSSRKYLMVVSTGLGAVAPRPHSEVFLMSSDIFDELVDVALLAPALGDGLQHFHEAQSPFPARGAFAAGLIPGEVQEILGDVHHAILFVHDDHAAGTHDGAQGRQGVVVHRRI